MPKQRIVWSVVEYGKNHTELEKRQIKRRIFWKITSTKNKQIIQTGISVDYYFAQYIFLIILKYKSNEKRNDRYSICKSNSEKVIFWNGNDISN